MDLIIEKFKSTLSLSSEHSYERVDFNLSIIKPIHAKCMIKVQRENDYFCSICNFIT